MPKHSEDTNSYSMMVVTNKRPDGRFQYKITLPKALGDSAMVVKSPIVGEFRLSEIGYGSEEPTMVFQMDRFRNPPETAQTQLIDATWTDLVCPFCGEPADPPLFPQGSEPISHKPVHGCGSLYYADRSDRRGVRDWGNIRGTGKDWKIVHNYNIQFGRVASNLPLDFDVQEDDDRMVHVVFLKPGLSEPVYADLVAQLK